MSKVTDKSKKIPLSPLARHFKRVQAVVPDETAEALAGIHKLLNPKEKVSVTIRRVLECGLENLDTSKFEDPGENQ